MKNRKWLIGICVVVAAAAVLWIIPDTHDQIMGMFQSRDYFKGRHKNEWVKALSDPDQKLRRKALRDVNYIDSSSGDNPTPLLVEVLKSDNEVARASAAQALTGLGADGKAAIPDLQKALKDKSTDVVVNAEDALSRMMPESKPAMPDLIQNLAEDKPDRVREHAASALAGFQDSARDAVPALAKNYHDSKAGENVRRTAGQALWNIDKAAAQKEGVPPPVAAKLAAPAPR